MDPVCSEPWSYSEVQTFLQIIGDEEVQRSLYGAVRNGKVFRQVSERMAARGFYRSPDQCRIKCKKLRCEYRKAKLQNEQSAANRKTWKWFNLMDAYFGHRTAFVGLEGRSKETCVPELPSKTASSLHISDSTIGLLPHKEDPDEGPFIADDEAEEGEEEQLMSMNCTRFQEPQATSKLYTLHLRKQIELTEATTRVKRKRLEELELDLEIKRKTLRKLELEIMKLERELCETR
ncbi:zinc finger and SCAN domain-containing protein 20-like isoform X2 [Cynoglossus semilaevis]|uniref:zinc finger and SCAN domain-containing protein 20-like isoform X2 n=1 Tax=Cynoglossus semilaevis TaxID=244447 RepID=UPI000495A7E7|nr:zinc finger and SCAN domain-containing protein 20-like isoform X2 [Cynoglossus semilaevis]